MLYFISFSHSGFRGVVVSSFVADLQSRRPYNWEIFQYVRKLWEELFQKHKDQIMYVSSRS